MQSRFVVALVTLFCFAANAQKLELGKVSVKELQENSYAADTNAVAAILFHKVRTYFRYDRTKGFTARHEHQFRIKIYKKEGLVHANFEVPYFVGYKELDDDYVTFSDAVTYNLDNGTIVKTKLTGKGTFKKDLNEFWNVASIAMPNVKVGSIIEFSYTQRSEDLLEFPICTFQYDIPAAFSQYTTEIPEFFIYRPILLGSEKIQSESKVVSGYQNFSNENQQSVNLSFQQINSVYTVENLPALVDEPYVDHLDNYRTAIVHELEKTRFPDAPEKNYATTWEGVAKMIYKNKTFGGELAQRNFFEQDIPPLFRFTATDTEKISAILEFVKTKVKWNGRYGYNTNKGVKQAYADGTGNDAEVNLVLISMLNHAGLNANPVLISTVSNGIPVFPSQTVFNYVIAAVAVEEKQVLLDATEKYAAPGLLPERDLNWTGRLIRQDGSSEEINLVPKLPAKSMVTVVSKMDANGKISGKARIVKTDMDALEFREKSGGQAHEDYIEKYENDHGQLQISDYAIDGIADVSKPISETYSFATDNESEVLNGKIYLNPILFFTKTKNPFVLETRKLPIYFGYPQQQKYSVSIEIPEGYIIESLPKPLSLTTGENVANFTFNSQSNGNKIQILMTSEVNSALISSEFYGNLKLFYQKMIEKQNEKIILKKI